MRSAKVSADDPSVALRAPAPFPQGSLRLTALKTPACKAAKRRAGQQVLSTEAGSRPGDLRPAAAAAPSPPKSLCGQADRRHFQQKQAADRGLSSPVPRGKVQEGESPSWFPAQAGKNQDHFSRRRVRREKFFSRSEVPEVRRSPALRHPSAVLCHRLSARRALRRGTLAD